MSLHKGKLRIILFIASHVEKSSYYFASKFLWKVADLNFPFLPRMRRLRKKTNKQPTCAWGHLKTAQLTKTLYGIHINPTVNLLPPTLPSECWLVSCMDLSDGAFLGEETDAQIGACLGQSHTSNRRSSWISHSAFLNLFPNNYFYLIHWLYMYRWKLTQVYDCLKSCQLGLPWRSSG